MIAYCPAWRTSPSIWSGSRRRLKPWQKNKSRPEAALVVGWRLDKSILPRGGGFGNDYERNCSGGNKPLQRPLTASQRTRGGRECCDIAAASQGIRRRLEWAPQGPRPRQQNKKDCDYCGIRSIENYECTVKKYQVLPIKRRC